MRTHRAIKFLTLLYHTRAWYSLHQPHCLRSVLSPYLVSNLTFLYTTYLRLVVGFEKAGKPPKTTHHLIEYNEDGVLTINKRVFGSGTDNLIALIEELSSGEVEAWPVRLTKPVPVRVCDLPMRSFRQPCKFTYRVFFFVCVCVGEWVWVCGLLVLFVCKLYHYHCVSICVCFIVKHLLTFCLCGLILMHFCIALQVPPNGLRPSFVLPGSTKTSSDRIRRDSGDDEAYAQATAPEQRGPSLRRSTAERNPWLHGEITRSEAEDLILGADSNGQLVDGTWLVRKRSPFDPARPE